MTNTRDLANTLLISYKKNPLLASAFRSESSREETAAALLTISARTETAAALLTISARAVNDCISNRLRCYHASNLAERLIRCCFRNMDVVLCIQSLSTIRLALFGKFLRTNHSSSHIKSIRTNRSSPHIKFLRMNHSSPHIKSLLTNHSSPYIKSLRANRSSPYIKSLWTNSSAPLL